MSQPTRTADLITITRGQYTADLADARRDAERDLAATITAVLANYSDGEDPEECAPEDRWRLFRDLRATLAPHLPAISVPPAAGA